MKRDAIPGAGQCRIARECFQVCPVQGRKEGRKEGAVVVGGGAPAGGAPDTRSPPCAESGEGGFRIIFGSGLLSHMTLCSIIGEEELNYRVRNGIGCTLFSMAAKKFSKYN